MTANRARKAAAVAKKKRINRSAVSDTFLQKIKVRRGTQGALPW